MSPKVLSPLAHTNHTQHAFTPTHTQHRLLRVEVGEGWRKEDKRSAVPHYQRGTNTGLVMATRV